MKHALRQSSKQALQKQLAVLRGSIAREQLAQALSEVKSIRIASSVAQIALQQAKPFLAVALMDIGLAYARQRLGQFISKLVQQRKF